MPSTTIPIRPQERILGDEANRFSFPSPPVVSAVPNIDRGRECLTKFGAEAKASERDRGRCDDDDFSTDSTGKSSNRGECTAPGAAAAAAAAAGETGLRAALRAGEASGLVGQSESRSEKVVVEAEESWRRWLRSDLRNSAFH
eukprot:GABV01001466.1.p1 GENE.GABV01001466.1~~GABV01001466.1.p1  ORF type:complete len:143 (-),score=42.02 GABV01001466.1:377-805(-)